MRSTLRGLLNLADIPAVRRSARGCARVARGRLRRRADDDLGLPDLTRGGAASHPLSHRHNRHRPVLRAGTAARPLPRAAVVARSRAAEPRPDPRALLFANRAPCPRSARGFPERRLDQPNGRRRGRASGPLPARNRAAPDRSRRRRYLCRRGRDPPPRRRSDSRGGSPCRRNSRPGGRRAPRAHGRSSPGHSPRRASPNSWSFSAAHPSWSSTGRRTRSSTQFAWPTASSRLGRRDALASGLADSLSILVAGLTLAGVLAATVTAHSEGVLDRVLIATLALLAVSSFEAIAPLPGAAREMAAMLAAGRRVLDLTDREPVVRDPENALPVPSLHATLALENVTAGYDQVNEQVLSGFDLRLDPGQRVALVGPSGAGKRRSRVFCCASSIRSLVG